MSALCQKRTKCIAAKKSDLFDHLVGDGEQRWRHGEAKHPCGLRVNDKLKFCRLYHRQVGGFFALEDSAGIDAELTLSIRNIGSVAHESAGLGNLTVGGCHGNHVACRQGGELNASRSE